MKVLLSFFVMIFACLSLGMAQNTDYSFLETYKVSTPANLNIVTSDGNIDVQAGSGNEIQVYYIARKNGRLLNIDRSELEKEVTLEVTSTDHSLSIQVHHDLRDSWWGINQVDVGFRIITPSQTACILNTSDGNISLDGMVSDQECKTSDGNVSISNVMGRTSGITSDGNVTFSDINGDVTVRTSDGNISLDNVSGDVDSHSSDGNISFNTIKGHIESITSDGSIRLNRITGDASAKTSDGQISFEDYSGSLTAVTSDGNISGNIINLNGQLSAKTSGGNVDITIPGKLGLDLDIRGESLDVPLVNFSGRSDKKTIHGQSNGGGIPVDLEASDGNVSLAFR